MQPAKAVQINRQAIQNSKGSSCCKANTCGGAYCGKIRQAYDKDFHQDCARSGDNRGSIVHLYGYYFRGAYSESR